MIVHTECWNANMASSLVMLSISLLTVFDILLRDVPPVIAKARLCAALLLVCGLVYALYFDQPDALQFARMQGSTLILYLVFLVPMIIYFLEVLVRAWTSTAGLRDIDDDNFGWFFKVSPYFKVGSIVYALGLFIAFQFSPTNAVIIARYAGAMPAWLLGAALTVSSARLGTLLHRHRRQVTEEHGPRSVAWVRRIELQIMMFVFINGPSCVFAIAIDALSIYDIADEPMAPWIAPSAACEVEVAGNILKNAALTAILLMTRSPRAKHRTSLLSSLLSQTKTNIDLPSTTESIPHHKHAETEAGAGAPALSMSRSV